MICARALTLLAIVSWPCGLGWAQTTQPPQPAPPPASGQAPADGESGGAKELPPIEVTAQSPKKKSSKPSVEAKPIVQPKAAPAAATAQPAGPTNQSDLAGTPGSGTGPVEGYVAKQTTTGSKTDTPLRQIPQSISVVGQEQMRDQGAKNWQEALRYVPGVVADGYGLDSRTDTAIIRGTEAAEFLDGLKRTFNYYVYSYRIDPYFMERIEVLRGPPSVLYGQAPVGGIVNSVSKRPQDEAHNEITVEYGTYDYKQVKADLTGPLTADGKWSYRVVGLLRDADTQVDYVPDDRMALSPSLTFRPDAGTSITLLGHFQNDETGSTQQFLPHLGTRFPTINGFIPSERFVGEPGFDRYDTDVKSGSLFIDHKIDDTFRVRSNMRYADIHNAYDTYYPGFFAGDPTYLDATERTISRIKAAGDADTQQFNSDTSLEAKAETGALRHTFIGGLDYATFRAKSTYGDVLIETPFDVFDPVYGQDDTDVPVAKQPNQDVEQTGLYLQDQMRLGNWIAVVGARRDWLRNETQFSPVQNDEANTYRAGLMYEFAGGLTPYISYAQSFVPVIGRRSGGGTFDPQEGEMYEAGLKYETPGSKFVINSAVFDITENNRLASDPNDPNASIQTGAVKIQGFEFEAKGNLTANIRAIAAYSFTDAVYTGGDQAGFHVESVPRHLASLWALYSFDGWLKGWSAGAGVRYIGSSLDGTNSLKTPPVGLVDAAIAYDTKDWRWSINAQNLEDKEYLSTCLARGDCFVGARRTVMTGITYKF